MFPLKKKNLRVKLNISDAIARELQGCETGALKFKTTFWGLKKKRPNEKKIYMACECFG